MNPWKDVVTQLGTLLTVGEARVTVAHPLAGIRLTAGTVVIFGPRDEDELEIVSGIAGASRSFAAHG
ncbi:MAG: hypothetical protein M3332_08055 [Actinomycetota bacterium]|jgi:hypothetical protein|nr:hypothetical protein [Actinomycetota bacterium]